jgi:Ca-activated chloride channel family protein
VTIRNRQDPTGAEGWLSAVSFLAPDHLWLLILVAAAVALYVVRALRRRVYAARLSTAALLASVLPRRPQWWRRHLPAGLVLLSLITLVFALARPAHLQRVPKDRATVMLAIDISESMVATDVPPNRLEASKRGAIAFSRLLPAQINLGLVSFDRTASVVVAPTTDHDAVRAAITNLQLGPGTAIGDGIFASLGAIKTFDGTLHDTRGPPPATIVLLSDGATNTGRPNGVAAEAARAAHIPVNTIAYGTPDGTIDFDGMSVPVPVDADALHLVATQTGGTYHRATSNDSLQAAYHALGNSIGYTTHYREITTALVGIAFALSIAATVLATLFTGALP